MKRIALTLTALGLALASTPAAAATSPHTVDPDLMTPALNPEFSPYTCVQAGTGITCVGESDQSYANEPIGLQCDGLDVYVTGVQRVRIVRWHDLEGRDGRCTSTSGWTPPSNVRRRRLGRRRPWPARSRGHREVSECPRRVGA